MVLLMSVRLSLSMIQTLETAWPFEASSGSESGNTASWRAAMVVGDLAVSVVRAFWEIMAPSKRRVRPTSEAKVFAPQKLLPRNLFVNVDKSYVTRRCVGRTLQSRRSELQVTCCWSPKL
ncbi:hypothetical protein PN36_06535 [Candidatus Thiomargarita nelsonii]|uniref:Uncharacterized protein n=1 Tax=Candidatus Thiomargarita nelsonii TaxID=1003181 RepID=A0A4E0QR77_9GAMM|nr:hypothetical protein PN36_06535 [Candidatus Thiomargarita nelsonii]